MGGLRVELIDRNMEKDVVLNSATIDPHGHYLIRYGAPVGRDKELWTYRTASSPART